MSTSEQEKEFPHHNKTKTKGNINNINTVIKTIFLIYLSISLTANTL